MLILNRNQSFIHVYTFYFIYTEKMVDLFIFITRYLYSIYENIYAHRPHCYYDHWSYYNKYPKYFVQSTSATLYVSSLFVSFIIVDVTWWLSSVHGLNKLPPCHSILWIFIIRWFIHSSSFHDVISAAGSDTNSDTYTSTQGKYLCD